MTKPMLIGVTGSIGMGKSTTATIFAEHGVPVWDADAAVHRLYAPGGTAVAPLAARRPEARGRHGGVDRAALKAWIAKDDAAFAQIERIVHPLVAADRAQFVANTTAPVIALDIPLLFETGADQSVDFTVVVSTDAATQRARVLAREGMTEEDFERILARQMPDAEKRQRADAVVRSDTLEQAKADVLSVLARINVLLEARHA
ncbi:MAG: dephospho-CoA kinase [Pseudomonadota bacterium]